MNAVLTEGKPVIVCLLAGSAIDLSEAEEKADAVMLGWYPGARGGRTIAKILFGEEAPSGKLPVTFYRSLEGMPEFTDYRMEGRTYRYLNEAPLYPFGYGLTYGSTEIISANADVPSVDSVKVNVTIKNTGNAVTEEVVQLYIKDMESPNAVKHHSLCGFQRVELMPGEEKEIVINVPARAFTAVREDGSRAVESNYFKIYAGTSQPDARSVELTGKKPCELEIRWN